MSDRSFLRPIGAKLHELRVARGLTIEALATAAGLSKGLLSKIENFRALPSLPVLATLATALDCELAELVAEVRTQDRKPYLLVRAGEGDPVARERSRGFRYRALQAADCAGLRFQAFHLELAPGAEREGRSTDGDEFLQVLRGEVELRLGEDDLHLRPGDSLYFDGRVPHAPRNRGRSRAELLVIYLVPAHDATPRRGRPRKGGDGHP